MEGLNRKLKQLTEDAIRSSAMFKERSKDIDRTRVKAIKVIDPFSVNENWEITFNGTCLLDATLNESSCNKKFSGNARVVTLDTVEIEPNVIMLR